MKWQEGKEAGRRRLSLDLDGARVYKYAFVFSQVPFVNFFPALEPHPLSWKHHLGPLAPPDSRLHAGKPARRARVGVCGCPRNLLGGEPPAAQRGGWSGEWFGF